MTDTDLHTFIGSHRMLIGWIAFALILVSVALPRSTQWPWAPLLAVLGSVMLLVAAFNGVEP